ncbi:unnamed protein product, partial [Dovyalis caffra]
MEFDKAMANTSRTTMKKVLHTYKGFEGSTSLVDVGGGTGASLNMINILHNWDDEHCLKLLTNCCNALPKNGKVIVLSLIALEAPETSIAS